MTRRDLTDTLIEPARSKARWLVSAVRAAGFPIVITSAARSPQEQAHLVATGRSLTLNSRHVDRLAFDVDVEGFNRDDVPQWFWEALGPYAERYLGLRWGGRWRSLRDYGHFEEPRAAAR